jgi:hypothetical protein
MAKTKDVFTKIKRAQKTITDKALEPPRREGREGFGKERTSKFTVPLALFAPSR